MRRLTALAGGIVVLALAATTAAFAAGASGSSKAMPFTFYLTHYTLVPNASHPTGVHYGNDGHPSAKAPDGSTIALSGKGGWDPAASTATGGGQYKITNKSGKVTQRGTWQATSFVSFLQLRGWWPKGFKEHHWQGPPGSASFSGILALHVSLSGQGRGLLKLYCLMPGTPKPKGFATDGLTLTGKRLHYTKQIQSYEGVMYYTK
jgi:hypothetical protein